MYYSITLTYSFVVRTADGDRSVSISFSNRCCPDHALSNFVWNARALCCTIGAHDIRVSADFWFRSENIPGFNRWTLVDGVHVLKDLHYLLATMNFLNSYNRKPFKI